LNHERRRQSGSKTSYPAAIRWGIAVGATGLDDRVTLFSNSGNHITISARKGDLVACHFGLAATAAR
jgi:hypothetical protein